MFDRYIALGDRESKGWIPDSDHVIFKIYSCGVKTNRDDAVYDFEYDGLADRTERFIDDYNLEVDRYKRQSVKGPVEIRRYQK